MVRSISGRRVAMVAIRAQSLANPPTMKLGKLLTKLNAGKRRMNTTAGKNGHSTSNAAETDHARTIAVLIAFCVVLAAVPVWAEVRFNPFVDGPGESPPTTDNQLTPGLQSSKPVLRPKRLPIVTQKSESPKSGSSFDVTDNTPEISVPRNRDARSFGPVDR